MTDIRITIDDAEVRQLLDRMPQVIDRAIAAGLTDGSTYVLARVKRYPPQRSGSTYVRTGTLGRSWSPRPLTRTSEGWQVTIGSNGNIAPYNRVVMDRTRQARIHRGRWNTAQDIAEASESRVQQFVDARVRAVLG